MGLVTLTGSPGVGKTRLGLAVAQDITRYFGEGAVFVPLATVTDASLIGAVIAKALDLPVGKGDVLDILVDRLAGREMLLVMDNMEHLVAEATFLGQLRSQLPSLKLLVTRRVPLRLSGEHVFVVPPLAVPDPAGMSDDEVLTNPAVMLFCKRVQTVRSNWQLEPSSAATIASLPLMRASGVQSDLPALLHNFGYVALAEDQTERARALFFEGLEMHRDIGNRIGIAECLYGLASMMVVRSDMLGAGQLVGLAEQYESKTDMPP